MNTTPTASGDTVTPSPSNALRPMQGLADWLREQDVPGYSGPYYERLRRWASEVESAQAGKSETAGTAVRWVRLADGWRVRLDATTAPPASPSAAQEHPAAAPAGVMAQLEVLILDYGDAQFGCGTYSGDVQEYNRLNQLRATAFHRLLAALRAALSSSPIEQEANAVGVQPTAAPQQQGNGGQHG